MAELQQTKGSFKLVGKVKSLRSTEDTNANGNEYRRLNFGVQTSPVNTIYTEIFGMERDYVMAYSSQEKQSTRVDWDDRESPPKGYHVLGVNLFLVPEKKGDKFEREVLVEWDAIPYIDDNLSEGDFVMVRGELQFSEYENRDGDLTQQTRFRVQGISKLKSELDFDAEDFKETSGFEQDVVIQNIDVDKKENKAYVNCYIIDYKKNFVTTQFIIDGNRNSKLLQEFSKRMKFGDWVRVWGLLVNEAVIEDEPEVEDDPFGSERPNGLDRRKVTNYNQEMLIVGVDASTWEKKKYSEEDFVLSEAEQAFGSSENPFLDDDDEELPF